MDDAQRTGSRGCPGEVCRLDPAGRPLVQKSDAEWLELERLVLGKGRREGSQHLDEPLAPDRDLNV